MQNLAPGRFATPQAGQGFSTAGGAASGLPQDLQNLAVSLLAVPHLEQCIVSFPCRWA
jgi:hypothetical protein